LHRFLSAADFAMAITALEAQSIAPPATSLVGRSDDLARLRALIDRPDVRMVSLLGPGGVGKTRLGLQLIEDLARTCTLEPCMVLLSASSTEDEALATIARALGVPYAERTIAPRVIADAIGQRPMLLLLDNVEQLATQLDMLPGLLAACRGLTIVTTSRVPLRFSAEHAFPVEPLDSVTSGNELAPAVRLFIDRAQAVRPDLDLSPSGTAAIAEICHRLDGLPLAIELAAARTRFLPPATLLERLPSRLHVLEGGPRDAPERHRTMRATISWSYNLLTDVEQQVFRRLAVFANGGPLEAIEPVVDPEHRITASIEEVVEALVDHSLVRLQVTPHGKPRFRLLNTIREFAMEQLESSAEGADTRLAHAEWFAAMVLKEPASTWRTATPEQRQWVAQALPDAGNLSAALATLVEHQQFNRAVGMAATLMTYWMHTGQVREANRWLLALEPHVDVADLVWQASFHRMRAVMYTQTDLELAEAAVRQAIDMTSELGDSRMMANNRHLLGQILWAAERHAEAEATTREAMAAMAAAGDPLGGALYAAQLADGLMQKDDLAEAETLLREAMPVVEAHRPGAMPLLYGSLGVLHLLRGELDAAAENLERSLAYHGNAPYQTPLLLACRLETVGYLASQRGHHHDALRLLGAGTAMLERYGGQMDRIWRNDREIMLNRAATALTSPEIEAAMQAGASLSADFTQAVDLARRILIQRDNTRPAVPANDSMLLMADLEEPLTPRELDVLQLLASGRSNPAIAEELFISPRTVTTHLSRLYAKLNVNSRTEAVAEGMRLGLVSPVPGRPT
jgi:predicted ATPase/DNA-binding CsgD family transcriptional regulator